MTRSTARVGGRRGTAEDERLGAVAADAAGHAGRASRIQAPPGAEASRTLADRAVDRVDGSAASGVARLAGRRSPRRRRDAGGRGARRRREPGARGRRRRAPRAAGGAGAAPGRARADGVDLDDARAARTGRRRATTLGRPGQVVAVGSGERERGVGEAARRAPRARRLARRPPRGRTGGGGRGSAPGRRSGRRSPIRARSIARSTRRSSCTAWSVCPEQPRGRALEDPFEEPFEVGEHGHRARNRTRGMARIRPVAGTNGRRAWRYLGHRTSLERLAYTLALPGRAGWQGARRLPGGSDDGDPHRVVLRTVRHSLHVRVRRPAQVAGRPRAHGLARACATSCCRTRRPLRGDGRRPERGRAHRDRAPAGRVPQDLQLLHDLPPVHVRQLLEHAPRAAASPARRSPGMEAARSRRPAIAAPRSRTAPHGAVAERQRPRRGVARGGPAAARLSRALGLDEAGPMRPSRPGRATDGRSTSVPRPPAASMPSPAGAADRRRDEDRAAVAEVEPPSAAEVEPMPPTRTPRSRPFGVAPRPEPSRMRSPSTRPHGGRARPSRPSRREAVAAAPRRPSSSTTICRSRPSAARRPRPEPEPVVEVDRDHRRRHRRRGARRRGPATRPMRRTPKPQPVAADARERAGATARRRSPRRARGRRGRRPIVDDRSRRARRCRCRRRRARARRSRRAVEPEPEPEPSTAPAEPSRAAEPEPVAPVAAEPARRTTSSRSPTWPQPAPSPAPADRAPSVADARRPRGRPASSPWLTVAPDDGDAARVARRRPRSAPRPSGRDDVPTTLAGRPLVPRDDAAALWAASAREVLTGARPGARAGRRAPAPTAAAVRELRAVALGERALLPPLRDPPGLTRPASVGRPLASRARPGARPRQPARRRPAARPAGPSPGLGPASTRRRAAAG